MLSGRADSGESRMREICMSGSTRERGTAVIDAIVFHSVLSSLLYRLKNSQLLYPSASIRAVSVLRVIGCPQCLEFYLPRIELTLRLSRKGYGLTNNVAGKVFRQQGMKALTYIAW